MTQGQNDEVDQYVWVDVQLECVSLRYPFIVFKKKIFPIYKFSSDKRVGRIRPTIVKVPPYLFIRDLRVFDDN